MGLVRFLCVNQLGFSLNYFSKTKSLASEALASLYATAHAIDDRPLKFSAITPTGMLMTTPCFISAFVLTVAYNRRKWEGILLFALCLLTATAGTLILTGFWRLRQKLLSHNNPGLRKVRSVRYSEAEQKSKPVSIRMDRMNDNPDISPDDGLASTEIKTRASTEIKTHPTDGSAAIERHRSTAFQEGERVKVENNTGSTIGPDDQDSKIATNVPVNNEGNIGDGMQSMQSYARKSQAKSTIRESNNSSSDSKDYMNVLRKLTTSMLLLAILIPLGIVFLGIWIYRSFALNPDLSYSSRFEEPYDLIVDIRMYVGTAVCFFFHYYIR